jgi:serine/threonine protein kinase
MRLKGLPELDVVDGPTDLCPQEAYTPRVTDLSRLPQLLQDGRYQVHEALGEGGMASVYRVEDLKLGVFRALKVLKPKLAESKQIRARFAAEATTMARLHHPNILAVFDVGEDAGFCWFLMELLPGGHALEYIAQVGDNADLHALRITFDLLLALAAAHLAGVVHRDVKPDNLLMTADGTARLADFGIAQAPDRSYRTRTGMTMGTFGYMAPEQRDDAKSVGPPADLFAAGATLYALATGGHPPELFGADLDTGTLDALPTPIARVVRKATRYKTDDRYQSAREMAIDTARSWDELAALRDLPPQGSTWMARFDDLVDTRHVDVQPVVGSETFAMDDGPATVPETLSETLPEPPAPPPPQRRASLGLAMLAVGGAVSTATVVVGLTAAWWLSTAGDAASCAGVWKGALDETSAVTLILKPAAGAFVRGEVQLPGLGGQARVAGVSGRCPNEGGTLRLSEDDALDAGNWTFALHGNTLSGQFTPAGGSPHEVTLHRAEP